MGKNNEESKPKVDWVKVGSLIVGFAIVFSIGLYFILK